MKVFATRMYNVPGNDIDDYNVALFKERPVKSEGGMEFPARHYTALDIIYFSEIFGEFPEGDEIFELELTK